MKLCECGCGTEIKKESKRFVRGHNRRGKKQSEEHIRKKVEKIRGRKQSEETRKRISKSMKGRKQSEEHKKNLSESRKGKKQSEEHIRKRVEKNRGRKRSEETRKQMSISANNRIDPRCVSGYFFSEKMQKEIFYQSSYELRALEMFEKDENIWSIERYNLGSIKYRINGSFHSYSPDYFLNEKIVIEVKAEWMLKDEIVLAKFEAAKKYCREKGFEFKILTEKDLKKVK